MSLVVPDVGKMQLLDDLLEAEETWLHLYQNNYTPVDGSVLGSFTEADFSGYEAVLIDSWTASSIVSGRARSVADPEVFTQDGGSTGNDIYGYYITKGETGALLWAERGSGAPYDMNSAGRQLSVALQLTLRTD